MARVRNGSRLGAVDRAVLEALLPAGANRLLPLGVLDSGFEAFLPEFERDAAPQLRRAFRAALLAGGWLAPLLVRRLPPLSRLAPSERERALEAFGHSNVTVLRQLASVLKTVVALHYGAVAEVRQAIGYHA